MQHQIQRLIFARQQRNVSNFSWISNAENTVKVLHKLNWLMKNDKQIAFTELSFQLFSWRFVTIIHFPKPISQNVWIRILSSYDILPMTKSVILTAIMT